jgi:hypothetical protein
MRTASRLNSSLCIAAISDLLDGEYRSQKTGTKPVQVHRRSAAVWHRRRCTGRAIGAPGDLRRLSVVVATLARTRTILADHPARRSITKAAFRWRMTLGAMATEWRAEGLRRFDEDHRAWRVCRFRQAASGGRAAPALRAARSARR